MVSNGPLARENGFPKTGLETEGKSSRQGVKVKTAEMGLKNPTCVLILTYLSARRRGTAFVSKLKRTDTALFRASVYLVNSLLPESCSLTQEDLATLVLAR